MIEHRQELFSMQYLEGSIENWTDFIFSVLKNKNATKILSIEPSKYTDQFHEVFKVTYDVEREIE